jgi:hypothetical protein
MNDTDYGDSEQGLLTCSTVELPKLPRPLSHATIYVMNRSHDESFTLYSLSAHDIGIVPMNIMMPCYVSISCTLCCSNYSLIVSPFHAHLSASNRFLDELLLQG